MALKRRQEPPLCDELQNVTVEPMPPGGCTDCLAIGGTWVHLRYCVTCGETRCCDDSPNRHARKHSVAAGHPVVRSKEPGEFWAWCFPHRMGVDLPETA
jgi:hypothetical protein